MASHVQRAGWKKIVANDANAKGLISKIYKQLIQVNNKKPPNPFQKIGRRPKEIFLQWRHTEG